MKTFHPPDREKRLRAIGPISDLPERLARTFTPAGHFERVPKPGRHDWLAQHKEPGQTFEEYREAEFPNPDQERNILYLQPVGSFQAGESPKLRDLERFAEAFFDIEVTVRPALQPCEADITERKNPYTGNRQLLTVDVLRLLCSRLPEDAYCLLGITMADLYPDPSWNFVFGQASPKLRVGVYSFARYDPAFYGQEEGENRTSILLRRSCKVMTHESCHMLHIDHCIYFHCLMNGSNHLEESDARPAHLCPVCLRKLRRSTGFDPVERYRKLREFWKDRGWQDEVEWLEDRVDYITGED